MNESASPVVFFLDATDARRAAVPVWLSATGVQSRTYTAIDTFLADYKPGQVGCVVLGRVSLTMDDLDFYDATAARQIDLPVVAIRAGPAAQNVATCDVLNPRCRAGKRWVATVRPSVTPCGADFENGLVR